MKDQQIVQYSSYLKKTVEDLDDQKHALKKEVKKSMTYNNRLRTNYRKIAAGTSEAADPHTRLHIANKYSKEEIELAQQFAVFDDHDVEDRFIDVLAEMKSIDGDIPSLDDTELCDLLDSFRSKPDEFVRESALKKQLKRKKL